MKDQHKTLWTFRTHTGGVVRFPDEESCRVYAFQVADAGGFGRIIPPLYG